MRSGRAATSFAVYARSGQALTNRRRRRMGARGHRDRGAGEILLTSIDRDGTKAGFDCEMTAAVSDAVNIPVIASGGAGTFEHFAEVFTTRPRRRGARRLDLSFQREERQRVEAVSCKRIAA